MRTKDYIRVLSALLTRPEPECECNVERAVQTSVIEPFDSCTPDVWICAAAFHLESLRYHSELTVSDVMKYQNAVATGEASPAELVNLLWEAFNDSRLDDLRFHAAVFCLYCELIRDAVLSEMSVWSGPMAHLEPRASRNSVDPSLAAGVEELSCLLSLSTSLRGEGLATTVRDLHDLEESLRVTLAAVTALADESASAYGDVLQRFADAHEAGLHLNLCLLRADVSVRHLLFSMPGD
jgi:hypothetical protein